ncbi:MAG: NAD(P)/FAD-dependent oxidoreductase, partial [Actinomycetota bacterium]
MKKRVVILGAGFGGLELSTRLSALADELDITLIDHSDSFIFGFSKLEVLFGRQKTDEVRMYYRDIHKDGVEFRREHVTSIDAANRHVATDKNTYEADYLVVALGADYDPAATPGFVEGGYEFYSVPGAERLRDVLPTFDGGSILIAVLSVPFKCPPAPYESAFLLHDYLVDRGVRSKSSIHMFTPMESPIPVSPGTSEAIVAGLAEREIEYMPKTRVRSIDPARRAAQLKNDEVPYDLFIGIPAHRVPDVVQASGLTEGGTDGWIKVDRHNLRTPFEGVYALGDVADAPVPRAGVFAERAAGTVADDIVARLHGADSAAAYDGKGQCYIEFGGGLVGAVDADFLSGP